MDTEEIRKTIGRRIKARRIELDLSQREVGEAMGVEQSIVSGWERGQRVLRVEDAITLAKTLDISVGNLVGEQPRVAA